MSSMPRNSAALTSWRRRRTSCSPNSSTRVSTSLPSSGSEEDPSGSWTTIGHWSGSSGPRSHVRRRLRDGLHGTRDLVPAALRELGCRAGRFERAPRYEPRAFGQVQGDLDPIRGRDAVAPADQPDRHAAVAELFSTSASSPLSAWARTMVGSARPARTTGTWNGAAELASISTCATTSGRTRRPFWT